MASMQNMQNKFQDLELRLKSECEMGTRDVARRDLKLELPLSNNSTPGMARPNHLNLQGLSHGRPGGGSGRKKMQLTFQGSPSVTLRETIKSPDASEIDAKLQEIMKLTDILTIDGRKYDAKLDDMEHLGELGNGTCGHVVKMYHRPSGTTVAVKQMRRTGNRDENKRIIMDLEVVLKCHDCPYIVTCLGCFIRESDVWICMELMSTCLDKLLKKSRYPIPEDILGKISVATVKALNYLKVEHGVIHRDVKPSNILLDDKGNVKLCDFGISGRLVDSKAKTRNAGCAAYMAPERIDPPDPNRPDYDIRADVWSLGITLVELATGQFPYKDCKSDFEVLSRVLNDEPPSLPTNAGFSPEFQSFVKDCLTKNYEARPKYKRLLEHPFIKKYEQQRVEVATWYASICRQQDQHQHQRHPEKLSSSTTSSSSSSRRESSSRSSPKKLMSQASSASPKVAPKPAREACEMFTSPSPSGSLSSVATSSRVSAARDASPAPRRKFAVEHSPVPPRRLSRENSPAGPRNFQSFNFGSLLATPFVGASGAGSSNGSSDNTPPSPFVRQNSLTRDSPFYRQASFRSDAGGQFLRQNSLNRAEVSNFSRQGPLRASAGSRGVGTASYMPPVTPFVRRNSLSPSEVGPKLPPEVAPKYQPSHHPTGGSSNSLGGAGLPPSAPAYVSSRDPSPSAHRGGSGSCGGVAGSGSNFLDTRTIYYPERNLYLVQRSRECLATGPREGQTGSGYNASLPPRSGSAESSHSSAAGLASQYVKKGGDKISAWIKQRFPFVSGGNNTGGSAGSTQNLPNSRERSKLNDHHASAAASASSSAVHNKWYLPSPNARRRMSDTNAVSGGSSPSEPPHLLPPFVPTSAAANYHQQQQQQQQQQHQQIQMGENQHRDAYLRSKYTPEPVRKNFYHY